MDVLLEALKAKRWLRKRRNNVHDTPCNSETAWRGGSNSDLFEQILTLAPTQHYTFAQLNRSVEMKRHVDGRNLDVFLDRPFVVCFSMAVLSVSMTVVRFQRHVVGSHSMGIIVAGLSLLKVIDTV